MLVTACAEGTDEDQLGRPNPSGGSSGSAGTSASGGSLAGGGAGGVPSGGKPSGGMPSGGASAAGSGGKTTGGGGNGGASGGGGGAAGGGGASGGGNGGASGGGGAAGGGAGGMAGGGAGGMAGTGGGGATGFRHVRFEATSEQAGAVWSAVAELQLFTTGGTALPRSGWSISADSAEEDDEDAPASAAIDGDTATFWHTSWEPAPDNVNDDPLPHHLDIDLGSAHPITGFSYLPRQDRTNGRIKDWKFYVSADGTSWGTAIESGTFPTGATLQRVDF